MLDRESHLVFQQRHCEDQYRVYHLIEAYLGDPSSEAAASLKFQLPRTVVDELRARYYAFDDDVMRCFVGRKLTGKQLTKDLGLIANKTHTSFRSCRRQLENLRRVYRALSHSDETSALNVLAEGMLLPRHLAVRYLRISFLCSHRFEVGKRRLAHLDLVRLEALSGAAIEALCPNDGSLTLDSGVQFALADVRRALGEKGCADEYAGHVRGAVDQSKVGRVKWKDALRSLAAIAAGTRGRRGEFRDFFLQINDKVVEPLSQASLYSHGLSREDLARVFETLRTAWRMLSTLPSGLTEYHNESWDKFLRVVENVTAVIMFK